MVCMGLSKISRMFEDVAAGDSFLDLIQKVPPCWRERPAFFHLWLARKLARLSQAQLAERAGLSQSFVARVERGRDVRLSSMQRLYAAMGYQMLIVPLKTPGPFPTIAEQAKKRSPSLKAMRRVRRPS